MALFFFNGFFAFFLSIYLVVFVLSSPENKGENYSIIYVDSRRSKSLVIQDSTGGMKPILEAVGVEVELK